MTAAETSSDVEHPDPGRNAIPRVGGTGNHSSVKKRFALITPFAVMLVAAAIYGPIYFREDSIPTGVGANLVPAERVLKGEVPYRDFYKIQTPGILLLNAGLFKLFGISLLNAFRGVLVFKILAVVMVFLVARLLVSESLAIIPTALSLLWLPPGGPFSPAPIQYEMPLILIAIYFTLRWLDKPRLVFLFVAGLTVGFIALFKQNVGVYCAIALELSIIGAWRQSRSLATKDETSTGKTGALFRSQVTVGVGIALPLIGLLIYLVANDALGAAIRVFTRGPGEHIQMKFTGYPLPLRFALVLIAGLTAVKIAALVATRFSSLKVMLIVVAMVGAAICALIVPQPVIDNSIYWFPPSLFLAGAWAYTRSNRRQHAVQGQGQDSRQRLMLLVVLLFSFASYMEVFPRSVRGLLIGTLPPAFILLTFLFTRSHWRSGTDEDVSPFRFASFRLLPFAVVVIVAFVFGARIIAPGYAELEAGRVRLKADTELSFDRGRGIYLPAIRAREVNQTVELIQTRVNPGGHFFAHAIDATPYYFLADRNSPTAATLWNDAGTDDAERVRIMERLRENDVRLVLTSTRALEAERYDPLLSFLKNDFHESGTIGSILLLERNY